MGQEDDFQYAVRLTRVVLAPRQTLETFGTTTIRYFLVSELMDQPNAVRIREGKVYSERPQIITPNALADQMLNGFGESAQRYVDWLREHGEMMRILRYGLQFRKDEITSEVVHEPVEALLERVQLQVTQGKDPLAAVLFGADEMWEVSLLKFLVDYIERSAPGNFKAIQDKARSESLAVRREIEQEFMAAAVNPRQIRALGVKLQRLGMFEEYEDRFYTLLRRAGG